MTARWSFIGHPLRDDMPARWPEGIPLREEPDGGYVYRIQPPPVPRCVCTGLKGQHGKDRRGRATCFHNAMCACPEYVPADVAAAMDRHPAGKAIPQTDQLGDAS